MQIKAFKPLLLGSSLILALGLTACQPTQAPAEQQAQSVQAEAQAIPLIQAKVVAVANAKKTACDREGCTQFDLQSIESNVDWLNSYFLERIQKAEPVAFSQDAEQKEKIVQNADAGMSQRSMYVRYMSQQYQWATFVMNSYSYSAGAAHGLYHVEYVNFDLKAKKRLSLQDIVQKGSEQKVLDALYEHNSIWLSNHEIEKAQFKLSDNFYYGANGIVFVYPLYELASYAEGMPELELPYNAVAGLIKPEYLPSLPKYPQ